MMSKLLLIPVLLFINIQTTECLSCYTCNNVTEDSVCTRYITPCALGQSCFKASRLVNNTDVISLGCLDNSQCSSMTGVSNIVGRDVYRRHNHNCMECCSADICNLQLCNHQKPTVCIDDASVDCAKMNSIFSICSDVQHAKNVCPRFCGLCNVVDGEWTKWSEWSHCDVSCNNGTETRTRSCTNPRPEHDGLDCAGNKQDVRSCYTATECPIDGGWSVWNNWGSCSVSCDTGIQRRTRNCTNPKPAYSGDYCIGQNMDDRLCSYGLCVGSDCSDIKLHNTYAQDGIYDVILWRSNRTIQVYCDMTTDGGGWTVFQNRYDGSVDFYRNYSQYVHGFGDLHTEFWLGLDYIQEMTSHTVNELRIDLMAANGTTAYEVLSPFSLSPTSYVLNVENTTSSKNIDSIDRFGPFHNGQAFSTYDHDVDSDSRNCAPIFHGAWWYNNCYHANLNGQYLTPGRSDSTGILYQSFVNYHSLKQSKMAFRHKQK